MNTSAQLSPRKSLTILGHFLTFMNHDAGKEAAAGHVFAGFARKIFRQSVGHVFTLWSSMRAAQTGSPPNWIRVCNSEYPG